MSCWQQSSTRNAHAHRGSGWVWWGLVVSHPREQQEAGQGPLHEAAVGSSAAASLKEIILSCFTADSWNVAGTFGHQMGEGVGSTPRNSATAGRCPAVDLSSDTTYLECRVPQNCWGRQHSRLAPVPREQAGWSGGESNPSAVTVLVPGGSHGDGHREQGWDQGSQGWRWVWMDTGIAKEMGARPAGRRDSSMHLGLQDTKGWPRKKLKV